jgi:hypothetical protein
VINLIKSKHTI